MRANMINGEMLFIATFRAVLGLALAAGMAFLGWLMLRLLFPVADYSSTSFMVIAAMLVGGFGGIDVGVHGSWGCGGRCRFIPRGGRFPRATRGGAARGRRGVPRRP